MNDRDCTAFLRWALPRLQLRRQGFRKVRRQVCKRISRRLTELRLASAEHYRQYLDEHPEEWQLLDSLCRVTISRFYRNRIVFDYFAADVLPHLIHTLRLQGGRQLRVLSIGSASGEEPYTIALIWHFTVRPMHPDLELAVLATDFDPLMLERGRQACYPASSLQNLPLLWREEAFYRADDLFCLQEAVKSPVRFLRLDIRKHLPAGTFHIVLCRNLAFTYFAPSLQQIVLEKIVSFMEDNAILVTGPHEHIAWRSARLVPWLDHMPIYQKR